LLIHIIFNAFREALDFELPPSPADPPASWRRIIDTFVDAPNDICDMAQAPAVDGPTYLVQPHSVVLLAQDLQQQERTFRSGQAFWRNEYILGLLSRDTGKGRLTSF
jgi:hypothetical protein